ncbi:hypothetical protein Vi05172_g8235 [Venturia inaequalis]|nr:hypothetical protein Vi05172_g8235 [Venturia inaequalis]
MSMAKSRSGRKKTRQLAKYKPKSEQRALVEPQEVDNAYPEETQWIPARTKEEVAIVRTILYDGTKTKVENFLKVANIMGDIVCVAGYDCIKQIILLLRQLTEQTHGKNATELDHSAMSRFVKEEGRQFWANRTSWLGGLMSDRER